MRRNNIVRAVMSDTERAAVLALAEFEQRHISEVIREAIRERAKRAGVWPTEQTKTGEVQP